MIYLLHGNDYESSYRRLSQIAAEYAGYKIIHLDKSTPEEVITQTLHESSFFPQKEIIILEDLFGSRNLGSPIGKNWGDKKDIIIWAKRVVLPNEIKKLPKSTKIELHNLKTTLFEFLDAIFPGSKKVSSLVKNQDEKSLLWHLQNRLFLLILVKTGFTASETSNLLHKNLESWQWQKLQDQTSRFSTSNLLKFYGGALRADFLIKTGKTSLGSTTLASVLLLKYLK